MKRSTVKCEQWKTNHLL